MWPNQDLVTFTKEILNGKPHFLCKLIQRHYKLSKIEMNGVIGIIFFFCKIISLQLIVEEKILKHQLSLGEVVSPNQGCRQRNNCLRGLSEVKGFFSKIILVTRQKEG